MGRALIVVNGPHDRRRAADWCMKAPAGTPVPGDESNEGRGMSLTITPLTLRKANDFVAEHHRHSGRTARNGGKFAVGALVDGELVGIAIVGNPLSATLMDGVTAEVTRVCVAPEAPKNTCSFLYGRCWRIWNQMGGKRLVTYTLQSESGASLRGAGWKVMGEVKPHRRWANKADADGIERQDQEIYRQPKFRWEAA